MNHGEHQSDKQFFGPNADYTNDKRPVPDKSILAKLKGPGQPYPALQSKTDYDRDYVKDENSDTGAWKAQFEYDAIRNKIAKEKADAARAAARAAKEGLDADSAKGRADKAAKDVEDAKKEMREAVTGEKEAKTAEDFEDMAPSHEKLEQLKEAVKQAEENYEKEKKEFAECQKQLDDAKKNLEELKALQVSMEAKLAADTKLWVEQKSARMNLQKTKVLAAHAKRTASDSELKVAQAAQAEVDKVLAGKKALHEKALKNLAKEKADVEQAKKMLAKATLTQKLRGYKPAEVPKSSAPAATASLVALAVAVMSSAM